MIKHFLKSSVRAIEKRVKAKAPLTETPSIDHKRFLFIGGLHRSGTSILHRLLREHPATSGFENTGVPEDEGQHLQSLFPPAYHFGAPGGFAFDLRSHLTDSSPLVSAENRDKLLREWGAYYDLNKTALLEKSPPNLVRSRFFQALFPQARFLFIIRHPIAVAMATRKWNGASILELLLHWHVAYSIMQEDVTHLKRVAVIRYEDFAATPQRCLDEVCELLELDTFKHQEQVSNHNHKYFARWEQEFAAERELIASVFPKTGPMEQFGYSLSPPYISEPSVKF